MSEVKITAGQALPEPPYCNAAGTKRIEKLEGVMDWIVRVAANPGPDAHMALRRIAEEARLARGR